MTVTTTVPVTDIALAIYIGKNGQVVATESINGSRDIANNMNAELRRDSEGAILSIEVAIETREPGANGCCGTLLKMMAAKKCYDQSGNPVPCKW